MARLNVNPTRMELKKLKVRINTARRGHKLLKDKRDELMKQFLDIVRKNREIRARVEESLIRAQQSFALSAAVMSPESFEQALLLPKQSISVEMGYKNIMSVDVPIYNFKMKNEEHGDIFPYSYAMTSGELDDAVAELSNVTADLLELAETEKTAQLLAQEIEKTRRRVNALEHFMIPRLDETIRYITMKLDENERGNLSRLMKVKDMMIEEALREKQK